MKISISTRGSHKIDQASKLRALKFAKFQADLVSARAQIQYIATCTRPDLCAAVQLMATEVLTPSAKTFTNLNKIVKRCHDTATVGLTFVPLDESTLRLMLYTDSSFANTTELKSQLGFVLVLADSNNNGNIIHYGSSKCKRVTRSVMASEIHALIYGFDQAYVAKSMLQEIFEKEIPLDCYVDSQTLFNVVAKNSSTLEKRLQIDVFSIRESHERSELRNLFWIPSSQNIADALTKGPVSDTHILWNLMITNKITTQPLGWVEGTRKGN